MAVAYDNTANANSVGATTSVTFNLTVGANSNRAVAVGLSFGDASAVTGIAVTVGGVTATLVTGTDSGGTLTSRSMIYVVSQADGLSTGVLSVVASWTNNDNCVAGAVSAYNIDQTTPMINGTFESDQADADAVAPISLIAAAGDLTMTVVCDKSGNIPTSTDQTERWRQAPSSAVGGGGDTGPGTANPTHTWTLSATGHTWTLSGATFKQDAGGGGGTPALDESAYSVLEPQTNPLTISQW